MKTSYDMMACSTYVLMHVRICPRKALPTCHFKGVVASDRKLKPWHVLAQGHIHMDCSLPDMSPSERAAAYRAMAATMAKLHDVDPEAVGLADFGRRSGYCARQVCLLSHAERAIDWVVEPPVV
jgi:hypothetical protein